MSIYHNTNKTRFYCASNELAEYLDRNNVYKTQINFQFDQLSVGSQFRAVKFADYEVGRDSAYLALLQHSFPHESVVEADVQTAADGGYYPYEFVIYNIRIHRGREPANLELMQSLDSLKVLLGGMDRRLRVVEQKLTGCELADNKRIEQ